MVRWLWAAVAAGALLAACDRRQLNNNRCAQDADCGNPAAAFRCEVSTGACFCRTNDACPGAQFCNPIGFCQDRAGCEKNADCLGSNLFCDTTTGTCLARGRCTNDLQCALGEVCDVARAQCVVGCKNAGDCPGTSCRCDDQACGCTATDPTGRAACRIGTCDPDFCEDKSFCRFGDLCGVPPDAGTTRTSCHSDFNIDTRPYCARCTGGAGLDTCGRGANYCIIDTRTNSTYCGADCSDGQACPRGYDCRQIRVVLSRWRCDANTACPGDPSLPCSTDTDCARGGSCLKALGQSTGFCAGQCRLREGSDFGYCSCQIDLDCPQQTCSQGECSISRKRCINDSDCRTIRCVDFDSLGACHIGDNCTPANGLTCNEVQPR